MQTTFVIQQVIVLAILMSVGYISAKKNIITEEISQGMMLILTSIGLPSLVLNSFNMSYSKETLNGIILMFSYSIVIHLCIIILSKIFFIKYSKDENAVVSFGTIFPNSGFMGLPLIFELFGQGATLYASVFMIPYHTLLWTYGEGLFAKVKPKGIIKKLASTPSLIAIIIGVIIFIFNVEMPYIVGKPISMLSSLTSPLSMLILGEKITKLKVKETLSDKKIYYACFIKLIMVPIISLMILKALNAPTLLLSIIVIMQSLPSAVLVVILSQKHEGNVDYATKFTVISHILSILTIPLISLLI